MINFLRYRHLCLAFSGLMVVGAIGGYFYYQVARGHGFRLSVEFTGGTQIMLGFSEPVTVEQVRSILREKGWDNPSTREFSGNEMLVRVKEFADDAQGEAERVHKALQDSLGTINVEVKQKESVGPAAGSMLRTKSIYLIVVVLLAMLAYIALRFQFAFAVGAVTAIFHDAIAILAIFLLLDREMSSHAIVAIITTLGYSINDTIVIFSRIRENIVKLSSSSMEHIVNVSINETLRRTLLTSLSTALAVGSLFVIGGEALRDFSLAFLVGIIFGTYSSIYIASAIMLMFYKRRAQ